MQPYGSVNRAVSIYGIKETILVLQYAINERSTSVRPLIQLVDINIRDWKGKAVLRPSLCSDSDQIIPPFSVVIEFKMAVTWYEVEA